MAFELPIEVISREANAALATAVQGGTNPQFLFGTLDANGRVGINTVAGAQAFGVIQSKPQYLGDATTLVNQGVSKVVSGAALTPGMQVMSDANGRAVVASGTTPTVLGIVLGGTANVNEIASVQLGIL